MGVMSGEAALARLERLNDIVAALHAEVVLAHPERIAAPVGESSTVADVELEAALGRAFQSHFQGRAVIIGEEAASVGSAPHPGPGVTVFLDPIDGTRLLREGRYDYACTFAICVAGRLEGGGVYLPGANSRFAAARQDGLYLNSSRQSPDGAAPSAVVAVRGGDLPNGRALAAALERAGFQPQRLECTSRRLIELAQGRISGLVKHVGESFGVPRLWGVAAGLVACEAMGKQIWLAPHRRLIAVGAQSFVGVLADETSVDFLPVCLDEAWTSLCGA